MEPWISRLSATLFWDVDRTTINPNKHTRWLLERVLERGQWEDWLLVRTYIDKQKMLEEYERLRIDPKARNFLKRFLWHS